ncbi:PREDICTED: rho-related GTP-binding protein RhoU-like [Priapulus caudatus]|uniref:Rho-related GTP-binding protein RhoU-like n=1 Tax=Priapulus caudatus TaxID=37621 RepID=A0ABM1F921_PRICU|nr:PREDICTED: rho-related GTP-binding protein RhoU-like [Priapulus caudatus]
MPPHMPDPSHHAFGYLLESEPIVQSSEGASRVKCVLVGDGAIGKTSLVVSYTTNGYPTEYVPTAFDNYSVIVNVDNQPVRLQLCDTAGQDDFDSLRPLCYPNTDVFLLCFSVVSPTSFNNIVDKWLPEIRGHSQHAPVMLVGTQCDLRNDVKELIELARYDERPVSEASGRHLAEQIGALRYIECSALTQRNLKEVFDSALLTALRTNGHFHDDGDGAGGGGGGEKAVTRREKLRALVSARNNNETKQKSREVALSSASSSSASAATTRKGWKKWFCFL